MTDDGIRKAQEAIEQRLKNESGPVKGELLLKQIKEETEGIREMELRGAVWLLIEKGKISLTPERELVLGGEANPQSSAD